MVEQAASKDCLFTKTLKSQQKLSDPTVQNAVINNQRNTATKQMLNQEKGNLKMVGISCSNLTSNST